MNTRPNPPKAAAALGSMQAFAQRTSERLACAGVRLRLIRESLYPVVQVDVALRERSKDRMSDLDLTLLRLVGCGVGSIDALSYLSGLARHRLAPRLAPLDAQGLLRVDAGGRYQLTELGALSRDHGCMTTESVRGMLLCGLSGRPLPAPAYELPRHTIADLREKRYLPRCLLEGQLSLPLHHLDVGSIEQKKRFNLPDEVIGVLGVVAGSTQLLFLEGLMCLGVGASGEDRSHFVLPCDHGALDGVPTEQLLGLLEPLGSGLRTEPQVVLQAICEHYAAFGLNIADALIDDDGNPRLTLCAKACPDLRSAPWATRSLLGSVGTRRQRGATVHRLALPWPGRPFKVDVLGGRALTLQAMPDSHLEACADAIRSLRALENALRRRAGEDDGGGSLEGLLAECAVLTAADVQALAHRCHFDAVARSIEAIARSAEPDRVVEA
ncbi:MAG: hypothetical protein JSS44_10540 [Proteobacteria bacterium]|nr:hypothetical protein [Pseudomonadota bacterium]